MIMKIAKIKNYLHAHGLATLHQSQNSFLHRVLFQISSAVPVWYYGGLKRSQNGCQRHERFNPYASRAVVRHAGQHATIDYNDYENCKNQNISHRLLHTFI
jgi:hypothetical protein